MTECRPCASRGCSNKRAGKSHYCVTCRHRRRMERQNFHRGKFFPLSDEHPPEPPTSLKWLDSFSDWSKSGLSYAAYQINASGRTVHKK